MQIAPNTLPRSTPFYIGRDMGFYALEPDEESSPEIREGFSAGRDLFPFPKKTNRFIRKWIHLREGAYSRGKSFADNVTPKYLNAIDVEYCPVFGEKLTHNEDECSNWSIDRIDNDRGYERGNLAVMSTRANKIKSDLSYESVQHLAMKGPSKGLLTREQWINMYDLMSLFNLPENVSAANLDFFYRGQTIAPGAPLNWIMNFQIYLAWCIAPDKKAGGYSLMKIMSKQINKKRNFNIMFRRILKKGKTLENNMHLDVWKNHQNLKNLSRWLLMICPEHLRYLERIFGKKEFRTNVQKRNEFFDSLIRRRRII